MKPLRVAALTAVLLAATLGGRGPTSQTQSSRPWLAAAALPKPTMSAHAMPTQPVALARISQTDIDTLGNARAHAVEGALQFYADTTYSTTSSQFRFTEDWFSRALPLWEFVFAASGALDEDGRRRPQDEARPVDVLEVGSFEGAATTWMLHNIAHAEGSTITCVDLFESSLHYHSGYVDNFDYNVRAATTPELGGDSRGKVTKMPGRSRQRLAELVAAGDRTYDVIYIDGGHTAMDALTDTVLAWGMLKDLGVMIWDDFLHRPQDPLHLTPRYAVDAFLRIIVSEGTAAVVHMGYQLVVQKLPVEVVPGAGG